MQDMSTSQPSPLAGSTVDDLLLVTATVQAEATGSNTPLIKEELRYTIQKNRRRRGQADVVPKYNDPGPESPRVQRINMAYRRYSGDTYRMQEELMHR
ncbi:hypothetical protein LSAT2_029297 [Lamellibrachia satsuma]|nr:hypothetical protein LSAT2_029297 [Lamellibrachia satsuma]